MKHVHMLFAFLTIALFLYQFGLVYGGRVAALNQRGLKIGSHVLYTLLLISGVVTVMPVPQAIGVPHWVWAKIALWVVAIVATVVALRQARVAPDATTTAVVPALAKGLMLVALLAYLGIVGLAFSKPML